MFKTMMIIAAAVMLSACTPSTENVSNRFILPYELKDCRIYELTGDGYRLFVTRCSANNDTVSTAMPGKHPIYSSTVTE